MKLLNASKFALNDLPPGGPIDHPLDRAVLARLAHVVDAASASFDDFDYARALERVETFFWWFCDYYLELVKGRRYDAKAPGAASASRTLRITLSAFQRMLAPFLPFVTEEVWSWWQEGSIHRAEWPNSDEVRYEIGEHPPDQEALLVVADVLAAIRKAKSESRRPMRAPVRSATVHDVAHRLRGLDIALDDLRATGSIEHLERVEAEAFNVEVEFAPPDEH